jgi:hypothetical protein
VSAHADGCCKAQPKNSLTASRCVLQGETWRQMVGNGECKFKLHCGMQTGHGTNTQTCDTQRRNRAEAGTEAVLQVGRWWWASEVIRQGTSAAQLLHAAPVAHVGGMHQHCHRDACPPLPLKVCLVALHSRRRHHACSEPATKCKRPGATLCIFEMPNCRPLLALLP